MNRIAVEGHCALAEQLRVLLHQQGVLGPALSADGCLFVASDDVGSMCEQVRQCALTAIVLIVPDMLAALARYLLIAAIEPLAIECAPGRRVSALSISSNSDMADVIAAAIYLVGAQAVTGQVLTVAATPL